MGRGGPAAPALPLQVPVRGPIACMVETFEPLRSTWERIDLPEPLFLRDAAARLAREIEATVRLAEQNGESAAVRDMRLRMWYWRGALRAQWPSQMAGLLATSLDEAIKRCAQSCPRSG